MTARGAIQRDIDDPWAREVLRQVGVSLPRVVVAAATPTRLVLMRATYVGDDFVMIGGAVGGPKSTVSGGPARDLPVALGDLLSALGEAASVPDRPTFGAHSVAVPDALIIAEDIRAGAADRLAVALDIAELSAPPTWLHDLAHGVSASYLVLLLGPDGPQVGIHLVGLPCGWGHLRERDGELVMVPADPETVRADLARIAVHAGSPLEHEG